METKEDHIQAFDKGQKAVEQHGEFMGSDPCIDSCNIAIDEHGSQYE